MPFLSLHTPIGELSLAEEQGFIVSLDWGWGSIQDPSPVLEETKKQLIAYFKGELREFDVPLKPQGSSYRQKVWKALQSIPFGETRSYKDIASVAGGSPRSIGGANARNPIPILIPCHRVVSYQGLGGYSGGDGIETKKYLLNLERHFSFVP